MSTIDKEHDAFSQIHGQIKAVLKRSDHYKDEAEAVMDIDEGEKHARVSSVLKELDRLATAFKEREDDYHAFSLTPAMVQARNDQLNDQVAALQARAAKLEEAMKKVLSVHSDKAPFNPAAIREAQQQAEAALSSPSARDDGPSELYDKSRPYCPTCNFPAVSLGKFKVPTPPTEGGAL